MKKKLIILLTFVAIACGLSAQNIVIKGTINNAVAGQKVWISYYSSPSTCNVNDTTSTNSSGAFTYSFTIGSGCAKNGVRVSMLSCVSIYDTLAITKNYDTSKSTDTLIYNFRYCDTCKTVAKFLGWADSSKALTAKLYNFSDSANKFLWRFGDGQTSTAKNPVSHTYASPGTYNVCLIATDSIKGCKDSICKGIFVNYACSNFKAKFGFSDSVLKVQFYDSSPFSTTSYKWRFGDGDSSFSQNPSHTYSAVGTYNVCLIIRDSVSGCRDTLCKNVTIGNCKTVAKWSSSTTCLKTVFTNTSDSANKYLWKFNDNVTTTTSSAKNPTLMAPDVRSYIVTLIAMDTITGCKDSLSKTVVGGYTNSGFKAKFSSSVSGFTANFYDSSPSWVTNYKWRFGDGDSSTSKNPSHTYSSAGTYNACLIIRDSVNGCRDTLCKNITISSPCSGFKAAFVDSAQSGNTIKFTNLSSSTANKFLWKYGDGNTSATKNPTYNYSAPGTYTVCLIAYDTTKSCVDSICKTVKVNICSGFKASFVDSAQTGNTVKFTSTSTSSANKFTWKFGNGNTSTTKNPTHTYGSAGTYNVCLIVKDTINNCLDSVCKNVTAGNPCSGFKANFFDSAFSGNTAIYANTSSASANKFLWKFGDGGTSTTKNPTHYYTTLGTYTVCLIARDTIKNCLDSVCKSFTLPCSYIDANFTTYISNGDAFFYNTSKYFSTSKATIYFGDGTSTSFLSTMEGQTYADTGTYNVCLIVTDSANNCADTLCKTVKITNICKITASFKDSIVGNKVYLTNTSPDTASAMSRWMIFPGSGFALIHSKHTSYTFSGPGTYMVSLTVYDTATGCQDSLVKYINVGVNCSGFSAGFTNFTSGSYYAPVNTSSTSATNFKWNFGDGNTSTTKNPNHTYSVPGTYTVCLIASDSTCIDTFCQNITITSNCLGFTADFGEITSGNYAYFGNLSGSAANKFRWTFGDGNTSTSKNASNTYGYPGAYNVCLVALDSTNSCKDSICKTIYIQGKCSTVTANFNYTVGTGGTVTFTSTSTGKIKEYVWTIDTFTIGHNNPHTHTFSSGTTHTACLWILDSNNYCKDSICKTINISSSCAGFAANFSSAASGSSTSFTNSSSSGANKFKWTFGDGNTSTLKNPTNTYLAPGSYTACLVAYDTAKGCKDSICKTVTSCNFFEASFTNTDSCKTAYFSNTSNTKANKFSWNFGDATTSSAKNPTHSYATAGTYNVCLIAKDTVLGCIDTLCKNIIAKNTLSGIIYRDSAQVADSGMVWLIKVIIDTTTNDTILTPVDSTVFIASSGGYVFNNPTPGTYLIKAALFPGTSFYSNRIPTYYTNAVQWNLATYFTMGSSCATANITLVKGTNPGGSGFVGGKVSQGANKVGDPLAKRQVLLFNANNTPYGYTFTDSNGKYTFSNVAFGTYRVQVEVLGKFSENYNITMSQQNQGNLNGNFDENSKYITLSKTTGISSVAMGNRNLTLYPNPAENYVNLIFDAPSSGNVTIQISDMAGKQIFVKEHLADNGTNETQLEVAGLANGIYVLTIVAGDAHYVGRLSINR